MSKLVHLNVHTQYDRVRGGMTSEELAERALELGMDTVAITDPGHMIGTLQAYKDLTKAGVKPLLGLEALWCHDMSAGTDSLGNPSYPLPLLAMNNQGLKNLYAITTASWIYGLHPGDFPEARVDNSFLAGWSSDLICLTGSRYGYLAEAITRGKMDEADAWLGEMQSIFGDRLYLQVPAPHTPRERRLTERLLELGEKHQVRPVASSLVLYARPEDKPYHELKMATTLNRKMWMPGTDGLGVENKIGKTQRIELGFDAHMFDEITLDRLLITSGLEYELIENTREVADRIDAEDYFKDRMNRYPQFMNLPEGYTSWDYLEEVAQWALYEKMGEMPPQEYRDRMDYELTVIKKMGYSDYMLIVWEYLKGISEAGIIIGPGRGSAAGSLVSYALDITRLDPIKYGLIFERWLNIGRAATCLVLTREMKQQIRQLLPHAS